MSEFPRLPQKPLQYLCAGCGDRLTTGRGHRLRDVVTCAGCGTVCALDESVAAEGTRAAVKIVPTGTAAIMRPI